MKKIGSDALRNLPIVGTLLGVVAIAALGLAYWGSVTARERYLESRNFRLLGDVAEQTWSMLYNSEQIVHRAIQDAADAVTKLPPDKQSADELALEVNRRLQASRQSRSGDEREQPTDRRIAPIELWRGEATVLPTAEPSSAGMSDVAQQFKQYRMSVLGTDPDLRLEWTPPDKRLPQINFQVPAAALFAGAFNQARWDRAFSTMALATPDGRIVFAVGPQAAELKASRIAPLLPGAPEQDATNLKRFASAIADQPVKIAGTDFRMFTQPCCRADGLLSSGTGLVLVGLSEADALRSLSLAISPVLVIAGAAFVMACLVGWPFLKCSLMGAQQRLGRHDVINLLASGLFGLALATILLLTAGAYARLSADVDGHLQHLSNEVNKRFTHEIEGAAAQMQTMVDAVLSDKDECYKTKAPQPASGRGLEPCQGIADPWSDPTKRAGFEYADFITFAMVDESGWQAVKAASSASTKRIVNVSARAYFQHALSREQLWLLPPPNQAADKAKSLCPNGCYLEYISSWNTGRPQVVIAMPTAIDRLPVAALSIPMHALVAPMLPPGFEFALLDPSGIVQFHSDPQRNGQENLLLENDQNSRLRSLLAARSAGTFNTMYWGYPYRAYVQPTRIPGWSIVVFHAKQSGRALVLEWFTVATLLAGLYTFGWVVVMLPTLLRGAAWLWPDPLRRHWYVPLGCLALGAIAIWLAIFWSQPPRVIAIAGTVMPFIIWAIAYGVLAVRPAGAFEVKQWTEMGRAYRFAGTALLLLTAAVPAASFYALAFDRHIEAFVKERQIGLARNINAVVACQDINRDDHIEGDKHDEHFVRYDDMDHDGEVTCVEDAGEHSGGLVEGGDLHEAFEDLVPYFTSASVSLRELMHEKADDNSWLSDRNGDRELALRYRAREPGFRLKVTSSLPAMVGARGTGEHSKLVWVAVAALLLLVAVFGAAYFVIEFLLRRVLLADIVEPIRRGREIVTDVGQHLLLICDDPGKVARQVNNLHLLRTAPAASGTGAKTLDDIRREASEAPASQRIGIFDLEEPPADARLLEKRLEIVEAVMGMPSQTVLLFVTRQKDALDAWIGERCESPPERDRWSQLIARLRVSDLRAAGPTSWKEHFRNLMQGWRAEIDSLWQDLRAARWRARLLTREGQSDPKIDAIATELQNSPAYIDGSLTRDQILEEIVDSADRHYRLVWNQRSKDERVLLEHVAQHGLASAASRRVVRKLLSGGLLRKDPALRLMSESFRRFVLEPERRQEVATLEKQAAPSLWDRLRIPLALSGTLALAFLIVTQREALDTTVSMALGVTTAVPTLVKLTTLLAQLGGKGDSKADA